MPFPLIPIAIGAGCFVAGAVTSRLVKSAKVRDMRLEGHWGETCRVVMDDGKMYEGNLQELSEGALVLEVGEQRFTELPLSAVARVEILASS
jgi:hypothetical protein